MNIRTRRLARDYEKVCVELAGSDCVEVEATSGTPPNSYRVTYHVDGLIWDDTVVDTRIVHQHIVDIYLPFGYPKKQPNATMRTSVWHPNIGDYVCIGDYWSAGVTLVDIIAHIGDMLQYKTYNLHSPVNKAAAVWAHTRIKSFPVGNKSVLPAVQGIQVATPKEVEDMLRSLDDLDINLGPARERY